MKSGSSSCSKLMPGWVIMLSFLCMADSRLTFKLTGGIGEDPGCGTTGVSLTGDRSRVCRCRSTSVWLLGTFRSGTDWSSSPWSSSSGTYSDLGLRPRPPRPFFPDDPGEGFLKKDEKNPFFFPGDSDSCGSVADDGDDISSW